jgi:hypothetical protein
LLGIQEKCFGNSSTFWQHAKTVIIIYSCIFSATHTLNELNSALLKEDKEFILKWLKSSHLGIKNIKDENIDHYVVQLQETRQVKKVLIFFALITFTTHFTVIFSVLRSEILS